MPVSAGETGGRSAKIWVLESVALLFILAVAGYLRFTNLQSNPGWYSDEGTLADIARHANEGEVQYLAINRSTLLAARLPLAPLLASAFIPLGASPLETLRVLAATSGVLTAGLVFLLTRRVTGSPGLGLLSGGLLAIYPPAVFYSRIGFSYNLLGPLVLLALGGLWFYLDQGSRVGLAITALAIGVGSLVDLMMISLAGPLAVVIFVKRRRDLAIGMPLFMAPVLLYAAWMLLRAPDAFWFDLRYIASRLSAIPWWAQLPLVIYNFGTLILTDPWWAPALIGLLLARPRRWRLLQLAMFLLPLILLGRSSGLAGLRLYSISPLFPFIGLGTANLLWIGVPWILAIAREAIAHQLRKIRWCTIEGAGAWVNKRLTALGSAGLLFLVVLSPIIVSTFELVTRVRTDFKPENGWAYLPVEQAKRAAAFVNRSMGADEFVVASPALAWALEPQTADFQQSLAYRGEPSLDYPPDVPLDRFEFEADYEQAGMAVVDSIWREWAAVHLIGVSEMLRQIEMWPVLWEEGEIRVHQNPSR